jgi:putative two-component system response regulator
MVALQHHECWDGSGYPARLRAEAISPEACIVALCDVYDALREERAYKPALSHDQALSLILRGEESDRVRPTMFDPALLMILKANSEVFRATYDNAAEG